MSLIPENRGTSKSVLTVRLLVGGYLLYLVYQMYDGMMAREGTGRIVLLAFMALFSVAGITLIIISLKGLLGGGGSDRKDGQDKSEELSEKGTGSKDNDS